jgi:hypothetical protein
MSAGRSLFDQLIACTVLIRGIDAAKAGTGFFVAPGLVLTCRHVVDDDHGKPVACTVSYEAEPLDVTEVRRANNSDLALLSVARKDHPCVRLDPDFAPRQHMLLYGFPGRLEGIRGESVAAQCEGPVYEWAEEKGARQDLIKFTPGGVRPGMSGAPLLNEATGAVCGIVKRTRSAQFDQGGFAIPAGVALAAFPELRELNEAYHAQNGEWRAAAARSGGVLLETFGHAPGSVRSRMFVAEFAELIHERTAGFVGRTKVLQQIDAAIAAAPSGYVLLTAEPGLGKTAISAWLVKTRGFIHHFNIRPLNIRSPKQFIDNITAQLTLRYGLPPVDPPKQIGEYATYLTSILSAAAGQRGDQPVVIVVDALDEATDEDDQLPPGSNRLLLPPTLPDGVHFFLTSRPAMSYRLQVGRLQRIELRDDSAENRDDARAYVEQFIETNAEAMADRIAQWKVPQNEFIATVVERSEGNFMYLKHVLPDIRDGRLDATTITNIYDLPVGLSEYYAAHWQRSRERDGKYFENVTRPVVCMFATVREPVTVEQVARWTHQHWPELRIADILSVIAGWREFLDEYKRPGAPPVYRIYHTTFQEFLNEVEGLAFFHSAIVDATFAKLGALAPEE